MKIGKATEATEVFYKKNCTSEACNSIKKESNISGKYCEIFKNTYFEEHLRSVASKATIKCGILNRYTTKLVHGRWRSPFTCMLLFKNKCVTAQKVSVFGVILVRIQFECGKMRTRITSNTDTFHAVCCTSVSSMIIAC